MRDAAYFKLNTFEAKNVAMRMVHFETYRTIINKFVMDGIIMIMKRMNQYLRSKVNRERDHQQRSYIWICSSHFHDPKVKNFIFPIL